MLVKTRRLNCGLRMVAGLLTAVVMSPAFSLDPGLKLAQLSHDRWTTAEGAPAPILAIAQTPDGYLWVGGSSGLFRFDGVRFEKVSAVAGNNLLSTAISNLTTDAKGGLWVGYIQGGLSVIRGDAITHYEQTNPNGIVFDGSGRAWAATGRGVSVLQDGVWKAFDAASGFDDEWKTEKPVYIDRQGNVLAPYVGTNDSFGIARLAAGSTRFESIANPVQAATFAEAGGTLWAADYFGLRPLAAARKDARHPTMSTESWMNPRIKASRVLADRDDGLWVSTQFGISRIPFPARLSAPTAAQAAIEPDSFGPKDGLTSDAVYSLFEDREGSIWVGTTSGLDRFRHTEAAMVRLPRRAEPFAMAPADDGKMWVGNSDRGLMRVDARALADNTGFAKIEEFNVLGEDGVSALYRAPDGTIWVGGTYGGVWRGRDGVFEPVPRGDDNGPKASILAFCTGPDGSIWMSERQRTVYRYKDGKWTSLQSEIGAVHQPSPRAMTVAADGAIWTEWGDGLRVFRDGRWTFIPKASVAIGRASSLQARGHEVWVGGDNGVSIGRADHFVRLHGQDGDDFEGTSGIIAAPSGDVWLNGQRGLTRISAEELAKAEASPEYRVRFTRLDAHDNVLGVTSRLGQLPTAVMGGDGRFWFATNQAIYWIDPADKDRRIVPTLPAIIQGLRAASTNYPASDGVRLPHGTRDLRVDYTGPNFTIPQRVRFRYRLEGVDDGWQDALGRRQAFYTNLGPGTYRFLVNSTNESGDWADRDTSLTFSIAPWFWQTKAFYALCAIAGVALLWGIYAFRLKLVRGRMARLYEERVAERERIARDLHDTLLQSVQGMILRVHAASKQLGKSLPHEDPALADLEKALLKADEVMVEGRDRVLDLRIPMVAGQQLPEAIAAAGGEFASVHAMMFSVSIEGEPRPLKPDVKDGAYRIAREALLNAFRHSGGRVIEVQIIYGAAALQVRIRDDGGGIDQAVSKRGARPGHWGLTGMREQAAQMDAQLEVWSRVGAGTEVDLQIRAAVAYSKNRVSRGWLRGRRASPASN